MKKYLTGLLLILVTVCCTSKKENEKSGVDNSDISKPVGVIKNGGYHIVGAEENSRQWEARLKESFGIADTVSVSKFEIIKMTTQGEVFEDSYVLMTHTEGGFSTIAVMLRLKEDKFYFDVNLHGKRRASQAIMCRSTSVASGCIPAVLVHNKQKRLVCSSNDCEKVVSEMSF